MSAETSPIDLVLPKLRNVKELRTGGWVASCPAHKDENPSLSVAVGKNGKVLLWCHAGCKFADIVTALGLKSEDLFSENGKGKSRIVATYDYQGADGILLFQVVRKEPKRFLQRRPNGAGDWEWNLKGVRRVLYRLPELLAADPGAWVFVCEGEKSTDAVRSLGLTATCNSGGAGKWRASYSEALRGRNVCILPDDDPQGEKHAAEVGASLKDIAADVRIMHLPSVCPKSDPADWIAAGGTAEELLALVEEEPEPDPQADGWQIYTLADAYAPRPPIEYVVSGLLPLPSLSIVYAPPGCFKTMLLADLAACVAGGLPWLPPLPGRDAKTQRETSLTPVLWCDFDNGPRIMHERIEAVARARDLSVDDTPLYYASMPNPWLDAGDFCSVMQLAELIGRLGAGLVIIDNLRDVAGGADENKAEMGDVMSNFRRLAELTGAAVVLIHHQRKGNGLSGRTGDTLRGHSSIEAALDLALLIEREEHADTVKLSATKVRGADILPFGAVFTYAHKEGTTELAQVKFYGQEVEDLTSDAAIRRAILETVEDSPEITKGDLTDMVKDNLPDVGVNRIRSQVDYLAAGGKLTVQAGNRTAKHYSIPAVCDPLDVAME